MPTAAALVARCHGSFGMPVPVLRFKAPVGVFSSQPSASQAGTLAAKCGSLRARRSTAVTILPLASIVLSFTSFAVAASGRDLERPVEDVDYIVGLPLAPLHLIHLLHVAT